MGADLQCRVRLAFDWLVAGGSAGSQQPRPRRATDECWGVATRCPPARLAPSKPLGGPETLSDRSARVERCWLAESRYWDESEWLGEWRFQHQAAYPYWEVLLR